jgi:hypothetical protein
MTLPPAPTGLTATGSTADSVSLSWNVIWSAKYKVYQSTEENGTYTQVGGEIPSGTTIYTDAGLTSNTTYWYKVSAVNASGEGAQSTAISKKTLLRGHYYVRASSMGAENGSSWANASNDLQDVIETAYANKTANGNVAVVHVAAGTYKPKYAPSGDPITLDANPTDSRDKTFLLREGVQLLGGYTETEAAAGNYDITEPERTSRFYTYADYLLNSAHRPGEAKNELYKTILSGDIDGIVDSGNAQSGFNDMGGNAYHVVLCVGVTNAAVLDGFSIQGGNADGSDNASVGGKNIFRNIGGGMQNSSSLPTLVNVLIEGNSGGGMYNNASSPTLTNASIAGNRGSGMMNANSSSPILTRVVIAGNYADYGGGMYNYSSSPVLTNVIIAGNSASNGSSGDGGGGIENFVSSPTLTNVIIAGNYTDKRGGGINNLMSSPTLTNVTITGNSADLDGGGMFNSNSSSPTLTNVTMAGNHSYYSGGGIRNDSNSSFQIRNSIIWGNSANNNPGIQGTSGSIYNSIVQDVWSGTGSGNLNTDPLFVTTSLPSAPSTGGDYRLQSASPAIDAGSNSYYTSGQTPDLSSITTDLDGNNRFIDKGQGTSGNTVDMGAYELQ